MRIKLQEPVPRFYRRVWLDGSEYICFVIGIHWLIKRVYRLWQWTHQYSASDLEIRELNAYRQGFNDGKLGYTDQLTALEDSFYADYKENNDTHQAT